MIVSLRFLVFSLIFVGVASRVPRTSCVDVPAESDNNGVKSTKSVPVPVACRSLSKKRRSKNSATNARSSSTSPPYNTTSPPYNSTNRTTTNRTSSNATDAPSSFLSIEPTVLGPTEDEGATPTEVPTTFDEMEALSTSNDQIQQGEEIQPSADKKFLKRTAVALASFLAASALIAVLVLGVRYHVQNNRRSWKGSVVSNSPLM